MRYGSFDDERREYVITRPDTPLPWINYLGSEDYFGIISNTAGGYSFYRDARLRRLTRYRYNNAPLDLGGRYLYLRDDDDGDYWSPSWQPTQRELDDYECRHGMGYTVIGSTRAGIEVETRYFVPLGRDARGLAGARRRTSARRRPGCRCSATVEFCLWDAQDDATNFQRNYSIGEVEVEDGVIYHKTEYRERRDHFAYFACSAPLAGFDTQRDAFLGPYRGWDRPLAVERGAAPDSIAHGWQPIGAHHVRLELAARRDAGGRLRPGLRREPGGRQVRPAGLADDQQAARPPGHRALPRPGGRRGGVRRAARSTGTDCSASLQVETGNEHVDRMVNIWNAYQCMVTFNLSRSASLFESGIGRGMGFRDSNQDLLGFVHMVPERARERILDIAATQLPTGGAYHQYQPLTKRGNDAVGGGLQRRSGLAGAGRGRLPQGDRRLRHPRRAGPVRQPARAARRRSTSTSAGDRLHARAARPARPAADRARRLERLPEPELLLGHAGRVVPDDRRTGTAVSPSRSSSAACSSSPPTSWPRSPITAATPPRPIACRAAAASMVAAVERTAGTANGSGAPTTTSAQPIGSAENDEGQIFIEPQGMCVMAGIGLDDGRAPNAPWRRSASDSRPRTASSCSSRLTALLAASWARSRPIRRATRRTPASSATPTRG